MLGGAKRLNQIRVNQGRGFIEIRFDEAVPVTLPGSSVTLDGFAFWWFAIEPKVPLPVSLDVRSVRNPVQDGLLSIRIGVAELSP